MADNGSTGARIRLLNKAELELLAWEFGGLAYCRTRGCREQARWLCSPSAGRGNMQRPREQCDRHAREFAAEHGLQFP